MKLLALHLLLSFLSLLVPKKKNLWLFGCGNGRIFQGNPKYIYLHLCHNHESQKQYFWVTSNQDVYNMLNEKGYPVLHKYSFRAFWMFLRTALFFIEKGPGDIYYLSNILGRFRFIQTWHGGGLKYIQTDAFMASKKGFRYQIFSRPWLNRLSIRFKLLTQHRYYLILATSEYIKKIYVRAFQNDRVCITGYPRNDLFANPMLSVEKLNQRFGLQAYEKVWLYVPTYRDHLDTVVPFNQQEWHTLDRLMKARNMLFLIKKHPYEKNIEVPPGLSHVKDVYNEVLDVQELLLHCDGLVSDYSTVYLDYSLKEQPIVFFTYDLEQYKQHCRGLYADPEDILPGPFARSAEELFQLILNSDDWFNAPEYRKKFQVFKTLFNHYQDGDSTSRLLTLLKQRIG